jgi:hypothetical protein
MQRTPRCRACCMSEVTAAGSLMGDTCTCKDYLTWKHANIMLSGQVDLSINGWAR